MAEPKVPRAAKAPEEPEVPQAEAQSPEPLTIQRWGDKANALIDEAVAANLPWGPTLAAIVAKRSMNLVDQARLTLADVADRFLASLEGNHAKTEKK